MGFSALRQLFKLGGHVNELWAAVAGELEVGAVTIFSLNHTVEL